MDHVQMGRLLYTKEPKKESYPVRRGEELEAFAKNTGISLERLALALGVNLSTLWRLRKKKVLPRIHALALSYLEICSLCKSPLERPW